MRKKLIASIVLIVVIIASQFLLPGAVEEVQAIEPMVVGESVNVKMFMESIGYEEIGNYTFKKQTDTGMNKNVHFLFTKNILQVDNNTRLLPRYVLDQSGYRLNLDDFKDLLHLSVRKDADVVRAREKPYTYKDIGKSITPMIAHAGGGYSIGGKRIAYTNSIESIRQNYAKGYRIFELDLNLTSDGDIALLHDWRNFAKQDGKVMSSWQWRAFRSKDGFTSTTLGDVLDEMMTYKDMYIVLDFKFQSKTDKEQVAMYERVKSDIQERDSELFGRVLPYVFNEEMMNLLNSTYHYPSVIYALYASNESEAKILNNIDTYSNIKIVATPTHSDRIDISGLIVEFNNRGLFTVIHTINREEQLRFPSGQFVGGIIGDEFGIEDWETIQSILLANE